MKKILLSLLALPFIGMVSCNNDNELPDVTIHMEYEGAQQIDNEYYVSQGDIFQITQITVTPNRQGGKVGIGSVAYSFDGMPYAFTDVAPFAMDFPTENMTLGYHEIGVVMTVLEEGCSPAQAFTTVQIMITEPTGDENTPSEDQGAQTNVSVIRPDIRL